MGDDNKISDKNIANKNMSDNAVKLESMRCRGLFLSVHPNDGVYINNNINHEHNLFYFLVQGKSDDVVLFKEPYSFNTQNTIIITHAFGGSIRINPKDPTLWTLRAIKIYCRDGRRYQTKIRA